jgi:hypothetical protein
MIRTGIFKAPVETRVRVNALHLDGDQQADLTVHGGGDATRHRGQSPVRRLARLFPRAIENCGGHLIEDVLQWSID